MPLLLLGLPLLAGGAFGLSKGIESGVSQSVKIVVVIALAYFVYMHLMKQKA